MAVRKSPQSGPATPVRDRILGAAFSAFMERGFERASMLDIATRARVSKRELYALFDSKQAMLAACIAQRTERMRLPLQLPQAADRETLAKTLNLFGITTLREVCDPKVLAVYRLAIAESGRSPEIARMLDGAGREASRAVLIELLTAAQTNGLFGPVDLATMAARFFALIWGDLMIRLLLRVTPAPKPAEIEHRVRAATEALLALYPEPVSKADPR